MAEGVKSLNDSNITAGELELAGAELSLASAVAECKDTAWNEARALKAAFDK